MSTRGTREDRNRATASSTAVPFPRHFCHTARHQHGLARGQGMPDSPDRVFVHSPSLPALHVQCLPATVAPDAATASQHSTFCRGFNATATLFTRYTENRLSPASGGCRLAGATPPKPETCCRPSSTKTYGLFTVPTYAPRQENQGRLTRVLTFPFRPARLDHARRLVQNPDCRACLFLNTQAPPTSTDRFSTRAYPYVRNDYFRARRSPRRLRPEVFRGAIA